MYSKKERAVRFLIKKQTLETIFTNLGAVVIGSILYGAALGAAANRYFLFSIVCFFVFAFFMALVLAHAALYIALPMDSIILGPYSTSKPNPPSILKEVLRAPIGALLTIPGVFYMLIMVGFFLFTHQLVTVLALNLHAGS